MTQGGTNDRIQAKKGAPRKYGDDTRRRIAEMSALNYPVSDIQRQLIDEFGDAPDTRHIARIAKEELPRDVSTPWTLAKATRDEAALVPPVLAEVTVGSHGRRAYVTEEEAKWIARVRLMATDLAPLAVFFFALDYMSRQQEGRSTQDYDLFLAFAPWRSRRERKRYALALEMRWVTPPMTPKFGVWDEQIVKEFAWLGSLLREADRPLLQELERVDRAGQPGEHKEEA